MPRVMFIITLVGYPMDGMVVVVHGNAGLIAKEHLHADAMLLV